MTFDKLLKKQLLKESGNFYTDNYDYHTHTQGRSTKKKIINVLKWFFFSKPILTILLSSSYIYKDLFKTYRVRVTHIYIYIDYWA